MLSFDPLRAWTKCCVTVILYSPLYNKIEWSCHWEAADWPGAFVSQHLLHLGVAMWLVLTSGKVEVMSDEPRLFRSH